jgi:predicted adenylyl cyclase CyaB
MKIKLSPDITLRAEKFGGVVYVPSRDDFFATDGSVHSFLNSLVGKEWLNVAPELEDNARRLASLQICQTDPSTTAEAYSGPSFIGQFEEIVTLDTPLVLNCFSTAHCPLRCVYCHADDLMSAKARQLEEIDDRGLDNVIAVAHLVPSIVVVITGGDPLSRPQRARRLIEALSREKALVLDTSGVAYDSVVADILPVLSAHRVHVRISLDCADAKLQEKLRPINKAYVKGISSFDSPVKFLSECLRRQIPVTVQTVVSSQNDTAENLLRLRDFLIQEGVRHWVLHIAVEAGLARKVQARHRSLHRVRGIIPRPGAMSSVWKVVKSTIEGRQPIDIRVTDNSNTPNSVLLVAANGALYTEGLAHHGKVKLFDPEQSKPEQIERLFYYIDKFGHARRYLNWNPGMFDGRNLNECCIDLHFPATQENSRIIERESKFRISDRRALDRCLKEVGFVETESVIIDDRYYDTEEQSLKPNDFVIRIRIANENVRLALKGPRFHRASGEYDRIELELESFSAPEVESQLRRKGLLVTWRLQRRRITFRKEGVDAEIVIDELPLIGDCLEIEGDADVLVPLAKSLEGLGNQESRNYREIIEAWCVENGEDFSRVYGLGQEGLLKWSR